jgi:integrase
MRSTNPPNLENRIERNDHSQLQEEEEMGKRIKRKVTINGADRWVSADTEQEYAENVARLMSRVIPIAGQPHRHNFRAYAEKWFATYSNPNIARATAHSYQHQLSSNIFPWLGEIDVEDVTVDHIQTLFNDSNTAKASKAKTRMVLNMIFEMALDDGIIAKNPMKSKRLRITGQDSRPTKEYTVEQMQYLVSHISMITHSADRAYLALQALHPLRLEEVLGLKWSDVDREHMQLHICRAATHPTRNMPEVKSLKTKASVRSVGLSRIALEVIGNGEPNEFIVGGEKPLSCMQVRRMCERIQRDTGFEDKITPIRFRTTVLTDIYDQTKDIKQAQAAAGHTTAAMTLKHYVKGRNGTREATSAIERAYGVD